MPYAQVEECLDDMVRLQAKELLLELDVAMIASGRMRDDTTRRAIRQWERQAGLSSVRKPKSKEDMKAAMAAMGIPFQEVARGS